MLNGAPLRVVHFVPGRVRIKMDGIKGRPEAAAEIAKQLVGAVGVLDVETNERTGSILIRYDAARLKPEQLLGVPPASLVEPSENGPTPSSLRAAPPFDKDDPIQSSAVARAVTETVGNLDDLIGKVSGGVLNFRTLIPLALLSFAIRRIILEGSWEAVPAHALLWYSYSTFHNMHTNQIQRLIERGERNRRPAAPPSPEEKTKER